jgi:hypothetical protein
MSSIITNLKLDSSEFVFTNLKRIPGMKTFPKNANSSMYREKVKTIGQVQNQNLQNSLRRIHSFIEKRVGGTFFLRARPDSFI